MLTLVHSAHMLLALAYLVGSLILFLALYPRLARLPAAQAAQGFDRLAARVGGPLGAAGGFTLLLGPLRAWMGGNVTTWDDLAQPYGLIVMAAFVLTAATEGVGGRFRRVFKGLTTDPAQFAAQAPALVRHTGLVMLALFAAILALMLVLGRQLY